jgi:hypothetical protein
VNAQVARQLRLFTIKAFEDLEISDCFVSDLAERAKAADDRNTWRNVFDETAVRELNGLRMPFADKFSEEQENRPIIPVGTCEFSLSDNTAKWLDQVENPKRLSKAEVLHWIRVGCCRRNIGTKVNTQIFNSPVNKAKISIPNLIALNMTLADLREKWDSEACGWWDIRENGAVGIWQANKINLKVIVVGSKKAAYLSGDEEAVRLGLAILRKITS